MAENEAATEYVLEFYLDFHSARLCKFTRVNITQPVKFGGLLAKDADGAINAGRKTCLYPYFMFEGDVLKAFNKEGRARIICCKDSGEVEVVDELKVPITEKYVVCPVVAKWEGYKVGSFNDYDAYTCFRIVPVGWTDPDSITHVRPSGSETRPVLESSHVGTKAGPSGLVCDSSDESSSEEEEEGGGDEEASPPKHGGGKGPMAKARASPKSTKSKRKETSSAKQDDDNEKRQRNNFEIKERALRDKVAKFEKEAEALRKRNLALKGEHAAKMEAQKQTFEAHIKLLNQSLAKARRDNKEMKDKLNRKDKDIDDSESRNAELEEEVDRLKEENTRLSRTDQILEIFLGQLQKMIDTYKNTDVCVGNMIRSLVSEASGTSTYADALKTKLEAVIRTQGDEILARSRGPAALERLYEYLFAMFGQVTRDTNVVNKVRLILRDMMILQKGTYALELDEANPNPTTPRIDDDGLRLARIREIGTAEMLALDQKLYAQFKESTEASAARARQDEVPQYLSEHGATESQVRSALGGDQVSTPLEGGHRSFEASSPYFSCPTPAGEPPAPTPNYVRTPAFAPTPGGLELSSILSGSDL